VTARQATISDQPVQPACKHRQSQGEPLEPFSCVETTQPYGSRGPDPAGVGNYSRGREPRGAGLSGHASTRPAG
jgi:hypothetical protein